MSNAAKTLLSNITFDNLKIAIFLLAIASFFMYSLFGLATVSPYDLEPFEDTIGANSNIFFTYFLDFSRVISSVFMVLIIVGFLMFQVVMISFYMNSQSNRWLVLILISVVGLYGWIAYVNPAIVKFENKFLASYAVGDSVYENNYEKAYGIVGSEKISEVDKAYLNAQISADQYNQFPTSNNQMLLQADLVQLNNLMIEDENAVRVIDANVLYKMYMLSKDKTNLVSLDDEKSKLVRKTYIYSGIVIFLYILAFYNILLFRSEKGMY